MMRNSGLGLAGLVLIGLLTHGCRKDNAVVAPVDQPVQQGLTASPASVSVSSSQSRNIVVSGGIQPYAIAQAPSSALAQATIADASRDTITVTISGVSVATGSTSVIIRDGSTPQPKTVTVGITKF
jgi:hypothetical protein